MNDFLDGILFTTIILIIGVTIGLGIIGILHLVNTLGPEKGFLLTAIIVLFLGGIINYISQKIHIKKGE